MFQGRVVHIFFVLISIILLFSCSEQENVHNIQGDTVILERNYSDDFEFVIMPPTGTHEVVEIGNTAKLLTNIPYLYTSGIFPSVEVLNEILSKGISDAGMSGGVKWEAYKVSDDDFDLIFKEVKFLSPFTELEYRKPDDWVKNYEDWNVWVMFIKHAVPWEEHKRLNDIVVVIEKEMELAKRNKADINELHMKYIVEGTKLSEFIMRHMNK